MIREMLGRMNSWVGRKISNWIIGDVTVIEVREVTYAKLRSQRVDDWSDVLEDGRWNEIR